MGRGSDISYSALHERSFCFADLHIFPTTYEVRIGPVECDSFDAHDKHFD